MKTLLSISTDQTKLNSVPMIFDYILHILSHRFSLVAQTKTDRRMKRKRTTLNAGNTGKSVP